MSEKLKFQKNYNKTAPKKPNYRLRQAVAGTVLAAVGVTGAVAAMNAMDKSTSKHYDKIEQEAIKEAKHGANQVIVLREGATYRTAPHTVNSGANEGPDTVAGRVGKGEVLRIDRPIVYTERGVDENHDTTWYGFSVPAEKGVREHGSAPANVYWVNGTALSNQNSNGHTYLDVYNYDTVDDATMQHSLGPDRFDVWVDETGNFMADLGRKGGPAALASTMPVEAFNHMAEIEHLVPGTGK